jgi:transcriptional regulator with XRE-family HTH domain
MKFGEVVKVSEARNILSMRLRKYLENNDNIRSVQELSNATGISPSYTAALLRGEKTPSLEYLFILSNELGAYVPEVILGLELYIKPRGYKISNLSPEEEERYYRTVEAEWKRFLDKVSHGGRPEPARSTMSVSDIHETLLYDKSMEALGMRKGSLVSWKEIDENIEAGKIYMVRYNNRIIPRRIWLEGDWVILIPCSTSIDFEVVSVHREDLDIVGIPIGVSHRFDQ